LENLISTITNNDDAAIAEENLKNNLQVENSPCKSEEEIHYSTKELEKKEDIAESELANAEEGTLGLYS